MKKQDLKTKNKINSNWHQVKAYNAKHFLSCRLSSKECLMPKSKKKKQRCRLTLLTVFQKCKQPKKEHFIEKGYSYPSSLCNIQKKPQTFSWSIKFRIASFNLIGPQTLPRLVFKLTTFAL